ncbi:hypothetical protein OH76DRAFT_1413383 [Lentinus brumalis]|uniref:Uncharacterized protein n=1 Tax=Lentinus brumalis TaxID=2498619 RepID=A0A371CHI2_9APHY|nr:hypothetical protein OH76DRAFT_1413383 [Polyporus brumalis]
MPGQTSTHKSIALSRLSTVRTSVPLSRPTARQALALTSIRRSGCMSGQSSARRSVVMSHWSTARTSVPLSRLTA